jgi:hypothetical protein
VHGSHRARDLAGAPARARLVLGIVRGLANGNGMHGARRRYADGRYSEHSSKRRGEQATAKEHERRKSIQYRRQVQRGQEVKNVLPITSEQRKLSCVAALVNPFTTSLRPRRHKLTI